jgi:hypothetical protein
VAPDIALLVNFIFEEKYLNGFFCAPATLSGRARLLEVMGFVLDTGFYQYFTTDTLISLVDDDSTDSLPVPLLYRLCHANQGETLMDSCFFTESAQGYPERGVHRMLPDGIWS